MAFRERPLVVFWEVTRSCSLACMHCRAKAQRRPSPGELTTEEALGLLDQVVAFGPPLPRLVFTGGDPLEREDLLILAREATRRGIPLAIAPAPSARLTVTALDGLRAAGVTRIAVSIDGATAETHDAFRRSPGSFAAAFAGLECARRIGLQTQVNTVVHPGNLDELVEIFGLVRAAGCDAWELIPLIPVGRAARLATLSSHEMEAVLHFIEDAAGYGMNVHAAETPTHRRVAFERRCGSLLRTHGPLHDRLRDALEARYGPVRSAGLPLGRTRSGDGVVFVSAEGRVAPSGFLPSFVGNVRAEGLVNLYRDDPTFRALRRPRSFARPCGDCTYSEMCGGSRARAFAATGNPLGEDPSCPLVVAHVRPGPCLSASGPRGDAGGDLA